MDTPITTTPLNTPPAPAAAPVAVVAPVVAPVVEAQPTPIMADGGSTLDGGGVKGFFSSLNWMEVGFSILGVAALSYVIFYYRFKLKQDKMINNELQRQIDEVKMNVQTAMKNNYKTV